MVAAVEKSGGQLKANIDLDCYRANYRCPDAKYMTSLNQVYISTWCNIKGLSDNPRGVDYVRRLQLEDIDHDIFNAMDNAYHAHQAEQRKQQHKPRRIK